MKVRDKVYEGVSHFDAVDAASKHTGQHFDDIVSSHSPSDLEGFTTSTGRFVNRAEAAKIAHNTNQTKMETGKFNTYLRRTVSKEDK